MNKDERQSIIVEDLERGAGRYHYCGLRDIAEEVRHVERVGAVDGRPSETQGLDRQEVTLLKSSDDLKNEFVANIARIKSQHRIDLFSKVCRLLTSDTSFADLGANPADSILADPSLWFSNWSTGHKIVMHATASLVANTERKSIVLIDEPESHLHPPLLASFMHGLRMILEHHDAFALIATHSPVVVQETLSRHVAIIRRSGSETQITQPKIETYGESIGEITDEVFGLNTDATDYHAVLLRLVDSGRSLEEIDSLFDQGLSLQARAYVMTEIARRQS